MTKTQKLPKKPGMYRVPQYFKIGHPDAWHTDGFEFYYLNGDGNWVDIGWGNEPLLINRPGPIERMAVRKK